MSERDSYPHGVPCWVATLQRDLDAGLDFYARLFGWEMAVREADEGGPAWAVARMRGRDVAGIGPLPPTSPGVEPTWLTHVRVDSAEAIAERIEQAGGTVLQPPLDLPPAGRLVVARDPLGATINAWEPLERQGSLIINEPGGWAMSALTTGDPQTAIRFYGDVFGWEAEEFGGPGSGIWMWRLPGYVGGEESQPVPRDVVAVLAPLSEGATESSWNVDFWIDDADEAAERVRSMGGSVVTGPYDAPPFRQVVVADPQGASFSLSQLRPELLPG